MQSRATVVILTALGVEYDAVRFRLESGRSMRSTVGTRYEVGAFEGTNLVWEVAVAVIGEGNVEAAIGTVKAIDQSNPDLILFVGVSGGLKKVYPRPLEFPITLTAWSRPSE